VGSLRYRTLEAGNVDPGIAEDPSGLGTFDILSGVYRLARDPAVDRSTRVSLESVGLADNPLPPAVLGRQVTAKSSRTPAGRPGRFITALFRPQERDLDHENRGTLAPGTIRRNVTYDVNGARGQGFFSWAANAIGEAVGFVPARPPQDEYVVSSLFLQLPDSLATVVSGTIKPAPGLEPFRQRPTVQAQPSTGWPVLAPQIPSYGSRVPLRRPRGLSSVDSG
jgi:hypothetical protein